MYKADDSGTEGWKERRYVSKDIKKGFKAEIIHEYRNYDICDFIHHICCIQY